VESKAKKSKQYAYPAKNAGKDIIFCEMKRECVCANGGVIVRVINDNPLYINFYRTQSRAKSIVAILYGSYSEAKVDWPGLKWAWYLN